MDGSAPIRRKLLGKGGTGEVYRIDFDGKSIAAKHVTLKHQQSLFREAKYLAELDHPNIVKFVGIEEHPDGFELQMEFVDGLTLDEYHRQSGTTPSLVLHIRRELLSALSYLHSHNVIHRDISPSNILLSRTGDVKLADFGLAKVLDTPHTTTRVRGTVAYMSPEQWQGCELDPRSDIYSLGVVLYELFANRLPYQHPSHAAKGWPATPLTALCPGLPKPVERAIHRMIAPSPNDRPSCADEALADLTDVDIGAFELRRLLENCVTQSTSVNPEEGTHRRRLVVLVTAALLLGIFTAITSFFTGATLPVASGPVAPGPEKHSPVITSRQPDESTRSESVVDQPLPTRTSPQKVEKPERTRRLRDVPSKHLEDEPAAAKLHITEHEPQLIMTDELRYRSAKEGPK